ncbi:hypothetical protein [Parabacteroides sp. PF5-6]|uniref:hypothetical protein n=1 Tax=Parabacteroides sp. PF5-6 TaxID=1742403 RepID=UPI002405ADB7|nr:hypothetical protein [Parabacteroides sp. PF5-6]MDF9831696.1 hypothetical protein [Parabacteroides sp. PF5-6]
MKKFLFILGLFLALLLHISSETERDEANDSLTEYEHSIKEQHAAADTQKRFEQIGKDMRNSNCLTPRRHVQTNYSPVPLRVVRHAVRIIQDIRLKEASQLQRVSEQVTLCQTTNYSILLSRLGYRIYALRKIII